MYVCMCAHVCMCVCILVVYVVVCTREVVTGTSIIGTIHLATTITPSLAASLSLPGRLQVHVQWRVSSKLCTRVNFHLPIRSH